MKLKLWLALLLTLILVGCASAKVYPAAPCVVPISTPGMLYYELVIGSFTSVHAYGSFSSYDAAADRVVWLKANGYMLEGAPYFIQPRHLDEPLVVIDAGK